MSAYKEGIQELTNLAVIQRLKQLEEKVKTFEFEMNKLREKNET